MTDKAVEFMNRQIKNKEGRNMLIKKLNNSVEDQLLESILPEFE